MTFPVASFGPLVLLALLLPGCSGPPDQLFPVPARGYPYAFATPDCAPWDGPAVTVYLLSAPGDSLPPPAPYFQVSLFAGLADVAPLTLSWPDDARKGSLLHCTAAGSCTPMPSGRVRVAEVSGDSALWLEVRLHTGAGDTIQGGYRATWRPRRIGCG